MVKSIFFWILSLLLVVDSFAQDIDPKNGMHETSPVYAFTNARIVVSADQVIERGTLVVKDGIIQEVGLAVVAPKGAIKIDLKGYTIYPSFVESFGGSGIPNTDFKKTSTRPQLKSLKEGPYYWNQAIHPETDAYEIYNETEFKEKEALVQQGFGTISLHQMDGILRGTGMTMTLGDSKTTDQIILPVATSHYSFSKGRSKQGYPSSQMGAIALIRQFFHDAQWYTQLKEKNKSNVSLIRGIKNLGLPQVFAVSDKLEVLRAARLAAEFDFPIIVKGGGDEYERIQEIKATGVDLIVPVNFPAPYDVTDPYLARFVSLTDLKDWELRPHNGRILQEEGITFSYTAHGLKNKKEFLKNIRTAVSKGLPTEEALRALTETPADMLGLSDYVGSLEKGKLANFLIVKGDLFDEGEIYENWIRGKQNVLKDRERIDVRGEYTLKVNSIVYNWKVAGKPEKLTSKIQSYQWNTDPETGVRKMDTVDLKSNIKFENLQVSLSFVEEEGNVDGVVQLNGTYNSNLAVFHGRGLLPSGEWVDWSAIRSEKYLEKKKDKKAEADSLIQPAVFYPNVAYGFDSLPEQGTFFITNATIWTNTEEGIIREGNLLIEDGKIKAVNKKLIQIPNGAVQIDAQGKHVTCGIIDEHSHIAISKGVNESGQNNSAEVSIADVVRSNDINIYRQLAGGVTASQLLHGSANPIGGKSALIKLKWGFEPEEMLIKDTDGFIKFALGENVKQSNWGDKNTIRYPQTRMGVEQVFYDAFIKAREYEDTWNGYNALSEKKRQSVVPPRKDLEMEALVEILNSERFISCHSYIQSEINMLMHVADSMGFTLNTFTHILEGYKVADKMKEHGAGASTFADWWAYKYEVNEAIPYNAAILHKMGVVTAINSDDAEMGRRLNQEAAKVVKYGGVSEEEAWKMVTLNPAILLHLDDRMGSIEEGKDADIVIWSHNPLSIQAKAEKTFVDGMLLYDINRSVLLHDRDQLERNRIMQLMLAEKEKGAKTRKPERKMNPHYHCDTYGE